MLIGKRLKELRIEHKLTGSDLALKLGVSKVTISGYENNTKTPSLYRLEKLADILEVDINYLLGRDISAINENKESFYIANKDLEILISLKTHKNLYNFLYENPERSSKIISQKIK